MKRPLCLIALILLPIGSPSLAGEPIGKIQIHLANQSFHTKNIQVKDNICTSTRPEKCSQAALILESSECQEYRRTEKCREARKITDQASCVAGLVYSGQIESGESVTVDICVNHTGKGKLAVRNSPTAAWVHHNWLAEDDTISVR